MQNFRTVFCAFAVAICLCLFVAESARSGWAIRLPTGEAIEWWNNEVVIDGEVVDPPLPPGAVKVEADSLEDAHSQAWKDGEAARLITAKHDAAKDELDAENTVLIRAIVVLLVKQLNTLRENDGLDPLTKQQVLDAIKAEIDAGEGD